jgi:hypothetical protein
VHQPLNGISGFGDNGVYPLKLQLLSADVPIATLRAPMIFLIELPRVPLNFAWTWCLSAPLAFGPDGTFLPGSLEADVRPGGRLQAVAGALVANGGAVDLALSPVLIEDLTRMARGYQVRNPDGSLREVPTGTGGATDAARLLATLKGLAARPEVELLAQPFGDPTFPALSHSGLGADLPALVEAGRRSVEEALGATPATTVARPPQSQLDATGLARMVAFGADTLLVNAGFLAPPTGLTFSPPPVDRVTAGGASANLVLPDAGVAALLSTDAGDPVLTAQVALGELATVWLEFPGTPGRGAAVLFAERPNLPAAFFSAFASLVRASPWLRPEVASQFVTEIASPGHQGLPERTYPGLSAAVAGRILSARLTLGQFRHVARDAGSLIDRLQTDLELAGGSAATTQPALAQQFAGAVESAVRAAYGRVGIAGGVVTLTSQSGVIPVRVANGSSFPLSATIRLIADRRISFVDGGMRDVVLPTGTTVLTFRVRARTTGRFPVKIQVQTSTEAAAQTIAETEIVVRSTAYNRVALVVTIGAALFLLAWWGRRFLPRPKS